MPNMSWIFDRQARAIYKSDWTDAGSVANAVEYYCKVFERSGEGENLAPFNVSRIDYRNRDREAFFKNLARAGERAVREFNSAFGIQWATPRADDHDPPAES
jgi:hypothetical protein